jgi:protein-disulfide isomerase
MLCLVLGLCAIGGGVGLFIALSRRNAVDERVKSHEPSCAFGRASGCPQGVDDEGSPWLGATSPTLTIEEFSDYECPPCRRGHREVRALVAEFPEDVRLVHRDFPVDGQCNPSFDRAIHAHACAFAMAASCAGEQGGFWEMNDELSAQLESSSASAVAIESLAAQLGLDEVRFRACLSSEAAKDALRADVEAGLALKLPSTPAFVIRTPTRNEIHIGTIPRQVVLDHLASKKAVKEDERGSRKDSAQ